MASGLREKVDVLETKLEKSQESALVAARHLAQIRFAAEAVGALLLGVVVFGAGAHWIAPSIGMPEVGSAIGGAVAWVALWIQLTRIMREGAVEGKTQEPPCGTNVVCTTF